MVVTVVEDGAIYGFNESTERLQTDGEPAVTVLDVMKLNMHCKHACTHV